MGRSSDRVIVVGAGVAGLAAAMRLAHAGLHVTVLERHAAPGGKMRVVPTDVGPVDAGPTVLTMLPVFEELFYEVGETFGAHVKLRRQEVLARHFWSDGATLDLFSDAERSVAAVKDMAGRREADAFRRFSEDAARLYEAFDQPIMRAPSPSVTEVTRRVLAEPRLMSLVARHRTLAGALVQRFRDPRLRQLFGRYATYVGGSPYTAPAVLALIWHAESAGVWTVSGGMHALARAMERLARARGATFQYGAHVEELVIKDGRVCGARTSDGHVYDAAHVLFNGDPAALGAGLLGADTRAALPRQAMEPRSFSAWVWAFAARAKGVELSHHNVFFADDPRDEFDPLARQEMPEDPTLYVCAEHRGQGLAVAGNEGFEIIMNAPARTTEAPEEVALCRSRTFPRLERFGLRFDPPPPDHALTTPAKFHKLFPGSQGALYGRSPQGMMSTFQRATARTTVPGLYLAGGGVHPGAGVPMATLSGRHAAAAILNDLDLTSTSRRTVTRGGISTGSPMTVERLFRSSPS